MVRLRTFTGVIVNVSDEKAERLGSTLKPLLPEQETQSSEPVQPAGNASLEDWQDYARSQGASDEDLDGVSRNDLRDAYGK